MNVSAITLGMLNAAVVSTVPDASPAEQGQLLADLIRKFDAESVPAPDPVPPPAPVPAPDPKRECKFKKCHRPWVIKDNGCYCAKHHAMVKADRKANAKRKPKLRAARPWYYGANMYAPRRFGGLSSGRARP